MKAFQKLSLAVVGALLVTACSKEVTVDAIPGFNPNIQNPSGPEIPVGRTGVLSQSYQNPYGTILFQPTDSVNIQVLRSCTDSTICAAMEIESNTAFTIRLNDQTSVYTHAVGNETWETHGAGNVNHLILSTAVKDQNGNQTKLIEDTYTISADPCGYGMGQGLEDRQTIRGGLGGQDWTTDSCQAYF